MIGVVAFQSVAWLWLVPLVALVWFVPRRGSFVHGLLRALTFVFLLLALARPGVTIDDDAVHDVLILDAGQSAAAAELDLAQAAMSERATRDDRTHLIVLDPAGDTPLASALRAAAGSIPEGSMGSVLLASDGLATDTRVGRALQPLSERGIPVHVCTLSPRVDDVRVVGVDTPATIRVGQTCTLIVRLAGRTPACRVTVLGGSETLAEVTDVAIDDRVSVPITIEPGAPGFLPLTVVVSAPDDPEPASDTWSRTIAVQDPWRVAYLGERVLGGAARLQTLVGSGFQIDDRSDDLSPDELDGYDVVMIDDRPAAAIPAGLAATLVDEVVSRGLGLVMAGGPAAFGPGGYHDTAIADLLPVELAKKEEKRDPSTTLVVIIDTSGSMGGNRVQLAKEVARLAIRRLLPHDKVGIVEFYGSKRWAAPIQPASNSIELERALNRLDAGGGTVILPAIEEAYYGLQNVRTRYKHVVVLTDGGVEMGSFEPLLRRMADKGINVSTVLIGPDAHSEFLVSIANWGKGRFYSVPNRFNLPEILLKQPAAAKLPAYREGSFGVSPRGGVGWWGELDPGAPAISGYVETKPRPGAHVILETSDGAHPVLGTWRYGLGRVTTMTTEPTGPGTASWAGWDGYGALLGRILTRTADDTRRDYRFEIERDRFDVTLTAIRRTDTDRPPAAWRLDDDDSATPITLARIAPDRYEATLTIDPDDTVRVRGGLPGETATATRLVSDARADRTPELQVDPRDGLDLPRIAEETGGQIVPLASLASIALAPGGGPSPRADWALWPACVLLALLLYLADIAWRRLARAEVNA